MIFVEVCDNIINLDSVAVIEKIQTNGVRIRYIGGYSTRLDIDYNEFMQFIKDRVEGA